MNCLKKELYSTIGKCRMYRFYNNRTGKTVNYKVYDSNRHLITTTDDEEYANRVLKDKANMIAFR